MSQKRIKKGLSALMRGWMAGRKTPFPISEMIRHCVENGHRAKSAQSNIARFMRRGEAIRIGRGVYRYNPGAYGDGRGKKRGPHYEKVVKAMYVSTTFASVDILPLAEEAKMDYVSDLVREFQNRGLLCVIGRRKRAYAPGTENIYHIPDRHRFRLEAML